jgi:hypothetical protein
MKTNLYIGPLCLAMVIASAFQPEPKDRSASKPKIEVSGKDYDVKFDKTLHDFGTLCENVNAEVSFLMINKGKLPLVIHRVEAFESWTPPSFNGEPIAPGSSTTIRTGFSTAGRLGMNNKVITVITNGGKHLLTIKYKVITESQDPDSIKLSDLDYDVKFDRTVHDFGKVEQGTYQKTSFTITNTGKSPVKIECCSTSGGHTNTSYSKDPVLPGKSAVITIEFDTHGKIGINSKTLHITTNGGRHAFYYKFEVIESKTGKGPVRTNND